MGNCLRRDEAVGKKEGRERGRGVDGVKRMKTLAPPNYEEEKRRVVRIKVVVTREELEQIMNSNEGDNCYLKESSVEKLVTAMKLRGRRIYEVGTNDNNTGRSSSNWRPALESIPEDQ